jgi:hypothetical protein
LENGIDRFSEVSGLAAKAPHGVPVGRTIRPDVGIRRHNVSVFYRPLTSA